MSILKQLNRIIPKCTGGKIKVSKGKKAKFNPQGKLITNNMSVDQSEVT